MSRAVKPLPSFTFQDSGITVQLRKLGPSTLQDVDRAVRREWKRSEDIEKREPTPPVFVTEVGPEKNEADPEYQAKRRAWEARVGEEMTRRLLELAALYAVEVEVDSEAVARLRSAYARMGVEVEEDATLSQEDRDRLFYITRICIASPEDMAEFSTAITQRSQPSEEAVQAHVAAFSGDVSGA